jgi:hypothetical protein
VRNFLKTGRVPVLIDEPHQVIQYFFLPLRQRHFTPLWAQVEAYKVGELKAKVNGTLGQVVTHFHFRPYGQVRLIVRICEHGKEESREEAEEETKAGRESDRGGTRSEDC